MANTGLAFNNIDCEFNLKINKPSKYVMRVDMIRNICNNDICITGSYDLKLIESSDINKIHTNIAEQIFALNIPNIDHLTHLFTSDERTLLVNAFEIVANTIEQKNEYLVGIAKFTFKAHDLFETMPFELIVYFSPVK